MPTIEVRIRKDGTIEADFNGFPNSSCDQAEDEILEKLKSLKMRKMVEERKDDELIQEDVQVDY
jgi:hypothetical protein